MAELHLIIIWSKALEQKIRIIKDIGSNLEILDVYKVTWSKMEFSNNLSRFYGENLPKNSSKEEHCGNDSFCCIVVRDNAPNYQSRYTSKGYKVVNTNLFDLKQVYRKWTGGGHKVHATDNIKESRLQLALLFGEDYDEYIKRNMPSNIVEKDFNKDLVGAKGWNSFEELFRILNLTSNYVILRNFEYLNDQLNSLHPDVDLLVEDKNTVTNVLNCKPTKLEKYRVQYRVVVKNKNINFDLRYVGDNYYCTRWERDIIKSRVLNDFYYVPSEEMLFYSLIYHALVHKPFVSPDYIKAIGVMSGGDIDVKLNGFDYVELNLLEVLLGFMDAKNYTIVEPEDLSVFFNSSFISKKVSVCVSKKRKRYKIIPKALSKGKRVALSLVKKSLIFLVGLDLYFKFAKNVLSIKRGLFNIFLLLRFNLEFKKILVEKGLSKIEVFRFKKWRYGYAYFTAYKGNKKVFLKVDTKFLLLQNDLKVFEVLGDDLKGSMARIYDSVMLDNVQIVIFEYLEGQELTKVALSENYHFIEQINKIINGLISLGIVHRDIKLDNFFVVGDEVKIIDFTYAVSFDKSFGFKDLPLNDKVGRYMLERLGSDLKPAPFVWNDVYSFREILRDINLGNVNNDLIAKLSEMDSKNYTL